MNITILGSGAMGSLYGGLLAASGVEVTLVDIWEEHVQAINSDGLRITSPSTEQTIEVEATTDVSTLDTTDVIIIFVKSTHTRTALEDLPLSHIDDIDFLTLQNGLGNPETIAEFVPQENVIAGVTAHGATLCSPGQVFHAGEGPTEIGRYFGDSDIDDHTRQISDVFTTAGIETSVSESIQDVHWEKVLVNIGINAPTAIARVKNGRLTTTTHGEELIESAVTEAARVARSEGCDIRDDIVPYVKEIAETTAENKSSMLQDIEAGRKTEIDYLHGAIVDRAKRNGLNAPINRTLAAVVRLIESSADET
jgi:2-dehydropantoate 2-reductase